MMVLGLYDGICYAFTNSAVFIEPESDHWQCLSVTDSLTDSLTHSCLVNLIDVILACEDTNSKLVDIVTVTNVLLMMMRIVLATVCCRFGS